MVVSTVDHKCPTLDFSIFHEAWLPKVQRAVVLANFSGEDAKDLVQDIFLDLISRDHLANFDSAKSAFSTYIWNYVLYVIRERQRQMLKRTRNEYSMSPTDESEDYDNGEHRGMENLIADDRVSEEFDSTELSSSLESIYNQLKKLRTVRTQRLADLFFAIVEALKSDEIYSQDYYAQKEGVKRQAINKQIQLLRNTRPLRELHAILTGVES